MAGRRKLFGTLVLLTLPTIVVVLVVLLLMTVSITTRVHVVLHADGVRFEVGEIESESQRISSPARVKSIGIEKFAEMKFEPARLEVADLEKYDFDTDQFAEDAWQNVQVERRVVRMTPRRAGIPATAIFRTGAEGSSTVLDPLRVNRGASVAIEVGGERNEEVTLKLGGLDQGFAPVYLKAFEALEIEAHNIELAGIGESPVSQDESLVLKAQLREQNPKVEVTGSSGNLVLNPRFDPDQQARLSFSTQVPVRKIGFTTEEEGKTKTTLVAGTVGTISYKGYPDIDAVTFQEPDFIGIEPADDASFLIRKLTVGAESPGMAIELEGDVDHLRTGPKQAPRDHLLTAFDVLWHSPKLMVLFSIVVWIFPTTLGAYRLYQELKG